MIYLVVPLGLGSRTPCQNMNKVSQVLKQYKSQTAWCNLTLLVVPLGLEPRTPWLWVGGWCDFQWNCMILYEIYSLWISDVCNGKKYFVILHETSWKYGVVFKMCSNFTSEHHSLIILMGLRNTWTQIWTQQNEQGSFQWWITKIRRCNDSYYSCTW